jgi:hypothetical protein
MNEISKAIFYLGISLILSIWIQGCWTTTDKIIEKTLLKEPQNKGLFLMPNIPNIIPNSYKEDQRNLTESKTIL